MGTATIFQRQVEEFENLGVKNSRCPHFREGDEERSDEYTCGG